MIRDAARHVICIHLSGRSMIQKVGGYGVLYGARRKSGIWASATRQPLESRRDAGQSPSATDNFII